jgi:hypothetical protein
MAMKGGAMVKDRPRGPTPSAARREVAYVISFYSPENQTTEQAIIPMQNTFKLL